MIPVSVTCLALLLLPFILGYIHTGINKRVQPVLIYYRYFMTLNMIIAGLFVTSRLFIQGEQAAQISGWAYSPIFHLYALAVLSMVIMGFMTVYSRKIIMIAPAICWSVFLILSTISYIYQLTQHLIADVNIISVHIVYSLLVSLIMLRFISKLTRRQLQTGTS